MCLSEGRQFDYTGLWWEGVHKYEDNDTFINI